MTTEPEPESVGDVRVCTVAHLLAPGVYEATLEIGEDFSVVLTPELAFRHAECVLAAAVTASYQAGVVNQMREIGADNMAIAAMLAALRASTGRLRYGIDEIPLQFEAMVTLVGKPFLMVFQPGRENGQWEIPDARLHAVGILESLAVASLDTAYHSLLITQVETDAQVADTVVSRLGMYVP